MQMLCLGIPAAVAAVDQTAKQLIEKKMERGSEKRIGKKGPLLRRVHNPGLAMGRMKEHQAFLKGGTVLALAVTGTMFGWTLGSDSSVRSKVGTALLLGGGISNASDRLIRGHVVDYLALPVDNAKVNDVTFNIGDVAIALGSILAISG